MKLSEPLGFDLYLSVWPCFPATGIAYQYRDLALKDSKVERS